MQDMVRATFMPAGEWSGVQAWGTVDVPRVGVWSPGFLSPAGAAGPVTLKSSPNFCALCLQSSELAGTGPGGLDAPASSGI